MQTPNKPNASPEALEEILNNAIRRGEAMCRERWEKVEDTIRESPTRAVLIAAGIGYFLHRLPLRSLLATQLKLLWAMAPPALMAVAAGKGFQALEDRIHSGDGDTARPRQSSEGVTQTAL